jgi:CRP-like cAMP-binding protein
MALAISDYLSELPSMPLFRGIEKEELRAIMVCLGAYLKEYEKGAYIHLQDEDILCVGVVLSGNVQMIREDVWGNKALLVNMGKGEMFGETFVCGGIHNRYVSFVASEKTVVLFASFQRVISSCAESCSFHRRLIENMVAAIADKNVTLMEKVDLISKKSLREKISQYLTIQAEQAGKMTFTIPLGRVQLAEYLHADRSALTRELNLMADEGLIAFHRNNFQILNRLA